MLNHQLVIKTKKFTSKHQIKLDYNMGFIIQTRYVINITWIYRIMITNLICHINQ